jgi:hypothetical protein
MSTWNHPPFRTGVCGRHDYSRFIVIDGYTFDGVYPNFFLVAMENETLVVGVDIGSKELEYLMC